MVRRLNKIERPKGIDEYIYVGMDSYGRVMALKNKTVGSAHITDLAIMFNSDRGFMDEMILENAPEMGFKATLAKYDEIDIFCKTNKVLALCDGKKVYRLGKETAN